jgi:hypothetical protein
VGHHSHHGVSFFLTVVLRPSRQPGADVFDFLPTQDVLGPGVSEFRNDKVRHLCIKPTQWSTAADKHMPPSSRVAAASKLLDLALRAVEVEELEARLTALEAAAKEKQ